jgi:hypothetical protein
MENASREYTGAQVYNKITSHTEHNGWEFVFLAANQDAVSTGRSMGIAADSSIDFAPCSAGVDMAYSRMSDEVTKRRKSK